MSPMVPRATVSQPPPITPLDSKAILTALYVLGNVEDWLVAFNMPKEVIEVVKFLGASFGIVSALAEVQKANAERDKAAISKIELQQRERDRERQERDASDQRDPYYKVKVRRGEKSVVIRFQQEEVVKWMSMGEVIEVCLKRMNEEESEGWELVVEDGAEERVLSYEDDVVGELLQKRTLILQRKD
eukprot:TRINITY_DN1262_c0_g2_i1.p1 TRINITY_DN1262_c0_g2~~TRINITY_DN1262_c0_g2_i1.p1  ORF type:complete len:210 (+),score=38.05 TRINITY_DN1262_c0_g2_i1:72-632(+)